MRFFAAGDRDGMYRDLCKQYGLSKLYSAILKGEVRYIPSWNAKNYDLMLDSGAHSWNKQTDPKRVGHIGTGNNLPDIKDHAERYLKIIEHFKDEEIVFVELDCYNHLPKTYIDKMYERVRKIKGKFRFIRVYHPVIDGGSCAELQKWVDEGQDYIGIGNDSTPILNRVFRITKDNVRLHGFAMTKFELLQSFPFFSVDSTTPLSTAIYGECHKKNLVRLQKKKLIAERRIEITLDGPERLLQSVINFKKTEQHLTQLWAKRGVIWTI